MYSYAGTLVRVVDGDTYEMDLDLGFHVGIRIHLRLLGIDCPEHDTPEGVAATAAASDWFAARSHVLVTTERNRGGEVKTFDRWVAAVTDLTTGEDLATTLRKAGHVKPVEHLGH